MPSTSSRKRVPWWADSKQARLAALSGAGEGPLLIAEELALQQVFRDGRHVDGHEGPVPPAGGPVDRVGEQLLAGAGLADQTGMGLSLTAICFSTSLALCMAADCPDHVLKAVLGAVALVEQLAAQLALPVLHVVEPLQRWQRRRCRRRCRITGTTSALTLTAVER